MNIFQKIYKELDRHFGPQYWWPAHSAFEVIIGAILTQNTAWSNVERAIINLKKQKLLNPEKLQAVSVRKLASCIKPAGYFNVKAQRLKSFVNYFTRSYNGSAAGLKKKDLYALREELLTVKGIGPETADSILLYALDKPIFVVDAYTKRILLRHKLISENAGYHEIQEIFMKNLKHEVKVFNQYHALIVAAAKTYCKARKAECENCPLNRISSSVYRISC